jgi:hypothetical protein
MLPVLLQSYPETKNLSVEEEQLYIYLFKKRFGFDPIHQHYTVTPWIISTWNTDEVPELEQFQLSFRDRLLQNPRATDQKHFDHLCKLWDELKNTERNTVIRPNQEPSVRLNVLTNGGMKEMGKRSTGESASVNLYLNTGSGTTAEDKTDDVTYSNSLQTEKSRTTLGSKATVDQQERYSGSINDGDVTGEPLNITEAGINTAASSGKQISRVTFVAQIIDTGYTMAFQSLINHRNGVAS